MKVYQIVNKINNKVYIGITTRSLKERFNQHKYSRYSMDTKFSRALKKYGIENFEIQLIEDEITSLKELYEKEKYYISKYNSYNNGYNSTLGGDGCKTVAVSAEEIVNEYSILKSSTKVAESLGIGENTVLRVLHDNNIELFGSGYEVTKRADINEVLKKYNELKSFSKVSEELNLSPSTVSKIIKNANIPLFQYGFSEENEKDIVNEYINSFYSMTQLEIILGINRKVISRILKKHNVVINNNRNKIKPIKMIKDNNEYIFESVQECIEFIIDNQLTKTNKEHTVREGIRYSITRSVPYYDMTFEYFKRQSIPASDSEVVKVISATRPDLPDIDIDTAGNKRENVITAVGRYFESIGGSLTQICTYGTEGAKNAIRVASRGLNLEDEIALYISSLVPSERGIVLSLKQCYYCDEDHDPIPAFVTAMNTYPELWKVAQKVEGLITRLGIHAAGVILGNQSITEHNSIMRTSKGWAVTAFDLHDSEYLGEVKYDFLSIDGLGKINTALNFMLKDNVIEWQGSLKDTYQKYLWPNALKYTPELWENIAANRINSLWQLNTDVGTSALSNIHASSLKEIGIINSLMRLQPQNKGDEQPLKTYERFRNNIAEWYDEMRSFGLSESEIKIMEEHLLILNGVADTQESVMLLVMDPRIGNFTIAEANKLRKGIAKKSFKAQEEAKELLLSKGVAAGTSRKLLSYVWNVQISRQLG